MDFDLTTLFYIAFALISFLASAAGKKKKKAAKQRRTTIPSDETSPPAGQLTFEELLKEFTGKKVVTAGPEPLPDPPPPVVEHPPSREIIREVPKEQKKLANSAKKPEFSMPYKQHKVTESPAYAALFSNPDDVKKAFIASEIFARKY